MTMKTPTPYPDKVDLANAMRDVMRRRDARIRAEAYRNVIATLDGIDPGDGSAYAKCSMEGVESFRARVLELLADAEQEASR